MALLHPCFWSQSQTSYSRVYTRVGRFDFETKPKITSQNFIPGIGQNYRTALLSTPTATLIYNFGDFAIFCLHRQYIHQMKAEIILSSKLPSQTCFVMEFVQKLRKKNFFWTRIFWKKKFRMKNFWKKFFRTPKFFFRHLS